MEPPDSSSILFNSGMSFYDFFDAPNFTAFQADLDPMRVNRGFCQDVLYDTLREGSGSLVLL